MAQPLKKTALPSVGHFNHRRNVMQSNSPVAASDLVGAHTGHPIPTKIPCTNCHAGTHCETNALMDVLADDPFRFHIVLEAAFHTVDPLGPERELETVVRCMQWLKDLAEDSVTHDGDWDAWNNFTAVGAWYRIDWRVVTRWVGSARKEELTPADLESGRRMREQLGVPSF